MSQALEKTPVRVPLYLKMAERLEHLIRNRSLRTGDRMPSLRKLALEHRVSIPTVLQTYIELENRGLIEARPKSGFYVLPQSLKTIPLPKIGTFETKIFQSADLDPVATLFEDHADSSLMPLGAAIPSYQLLPGKRLNRILASLARDLGEKSVAYASIDGPIELRRQLARQSLHWGCTLGAEDFLVTTGATEAVSLALRATCKPGDAVAVESPSYFGLHAMLKSLGLDVVHIPVHSRTGMDVNALAWALKHIPIKACVTVPNFQNPTGSLMPDENKQHLVHLCSKHEIALIEDDTYGDLSYQGKRARCLKAFDHEDNVILCGSFSKKLAPGYRVGYIAPGRYYSKIKEIKQSSTLSSALLPSLAIAEFLKNGGYERYLRKVARAYQQQTLWMRSKVAEYFPEGTAISHPQGGYLLWCQLPHQLDSIELTHRCKLAGISLAPGVVFSSNQDFKDCFRLNCGSSIGDEMEQALRTIGKIAHQMS